MTDLAPNTSTLTIPEGEDGSLYLFALDPPSPTRLSPQGVGVLPTLLGYPDLDPDFGEIISPARLGTLPLAGYIEQTYGTPVGEVQAAALAEAQGRLAIVRRRAFGEGAKRLTLAPGIWYLLTLDAPPAPEPIPIIIESIPPEPAPIGLSRLWLLLIGFAAFALTLLFILQFV